MFPETRSQTSRRKEASLTLNRAFEKGFASLTGSDSVMETGCCVATHEAQTLRRVIHVLALDSVDAITSVTGHCAADVKFRSQIKVKASDRRTDLEQNISCCVTDSAGVRGDEAGVSSILEGLVYRSCSEDYSLFPGKRDSSTVPWHGGDPRVRRLNQWNSSPVSCSASHPTSRRRSVREGLATLRLPVFDPRALPSSRTDFRGTSSRRTRC